MRLKGMVAHARAPASRTPTAREAGNGTHRHLQVLSRGSQAFLRARRGRVTSAAAEWPLATALARARERTGQLREQAIACVFANPLDKLRRPQRSKVGVYRAHHSVVRDSSRPHGLAAAVWSPRGRWCGLHDGFRASQAPKSLLSRLHAQALRRARTPVQPAGGAAINGHCSQAQASLPRSCCGAWRPRARRRRHVHVFASMTADIVSDVQQPRQLRAKIRARARSSCVTRCRPESDCGVLEPAALQYGQLQRRVLALTGTRSRFDSVADPATPLSCSPLT